MALKPNRGDSGITTEVSRPFSTPVILSAGHFYYDRAHRSSTTSTPAQQPTAICSTSPPPTSPPPF